MEAPVFEECQLQVGAFTASLHWTSAGSYVNSYDVVWQRDNSTGCSDENKDSDSTTITSYVIDDLFGDSNYSVTVSAHNVVMQYCSQ